MHDVLIIKNEKGAVFICIQLFMIKIYEENILLKNNYLEVKEEKKRWWV